MAGTALLLLSCALVAPSHGRAQATETYGLVIRAYCNEGTACSFADQAEMEAYYRRQMGSLNQEIAPLGFSLRLEDFVFVQDTRYSTITGMRLRDETSTEGARVRELRDLAADSPDVITLFILHDLAQCWSAIPGVDDGLYDTVLYAFFCKPRPRGRYSVLAHELGHHFCLSHTFTWDDAADVPVLSHDGDGLSDTPPDPGEREWEPKEGFDFTRSGVPVADHEWCDRTIVHDVSFGSPKPSRCTLQCEEFVGGTVQSTSAAPDPFLTMSYYGINCTGPYVHEGRRIEGFSPLQVDRVRTCISTVTERADYVDRCTDGDLDSDGICDADDLCPNRWDRDTDTDGDSVPDGCDNCSAVFDLDQADTDGDGIGDVCDADWDNDGCMNDVDEAPRDPLTRVGVLLTPGCSRASETDYAFAGVNSDSDPFLDCADPDDDGDGILDADDPCPRDPENDPALCQRVSPGCPLMPEEPVCIVGCDERYRLRLVSVVLPEESVTFDRFSWTADSVFIVPPAGLTAAETTRTLQGESFSDPGGDGLELALELWSADGTARIAELMRYGTGDVDAVDFEHGRVVALALGDGFVEASATWALSVHRSEMTLDTDGDEVPDPADNCIAFADRFQRDRDGDGFGDGCDPDFDGDGVVEPEEVAFVRGCEGTDVSIEGPISEPDLGNPFEETPEQTAIADRCRPADLDGDGDVDGDDTALAAALEGMPPGPAGSATVASEPTPGMDGGVSPDAGALDAGTPGTDAGVVEPDGGGCGCRTTPMGDGTGGLVALLLWAVALSRRRRGRRSPATSPRSARTAKYSASTIRPGSWRES